MVSNLTDKHYFTCTINGGNADHQVLELCPDQQFATTNTIVIPCINGQIKATGLKPHGTCYYRVVAICHPAVLNGVTQPENTTEDETFSDATLYKVPYSIPTFDISTFKPNGFATYTTNNKIYFVIGTINQTDQDH